MFVDARNLDPSPDAFMSVLWSVMGLDAQDSPFRALASRPGCQVILIDTYEMLSSLNTWMNEVFLPQLPERVLVVLASRSPPEASWRGLGLADPHTPAAPAQSQSGGESGVPRQARGSFRTTPNHPRLHPRPSSRPLPGRGRVRPTARRPLPTRGHAGRDQNAPGAIRPTGARPTARLWTPAPWCAKRPKRF